MGPGKTLTLQPSDFFPNYSLQLWEGDQVHFCEYRLSYNPQDPEEVTLVKHLYTELSEFLFDQGVLFTRLYGAQAEVVYGHAAVYNSTLKQLKKILDPNNIMNPGKLCF